MISDGTKLWQTNDFAPKQNECSKIMSEQEETGEIKGEQRREYAREREGDDEAAKISPPGFDPGIFR
jgi:hypothetical protein